jgi:hypothetical protein
MDIDTLISAISDLQNQAVGAPQLVGFFEGRGGKPILRLSLAAGTVWVRISR